MTADAIDVESGSFIASLPTLQGTIRRAAAYGRVAVYLQLRAGP